MSNSVAALVPMKGHSERVADKNVKKFNGQPLFHWVLNTLEAASTVDDIVINTDSEEIATEAAAHFDVTILERPEELRGDHVSMNKILLHDVGEIDADVFLQTHCTNPLLRPETVDDAIETYRQDERHDSLFSVTPMQTRLWDEDGEPINHQRDQLLRTQDLPPVYEENSNIYIFTEASIRSQNNRIGDEPMMYEMDVREAIDIDEPIDFRVAEFYHRDSYGEEPTRQEVLER